MKKAITMIIVTGGAGLIGSAIVWALNQRGEEDILVVDHLGTSEKWRNLAGLRFLDYVEKDDFFEQVRSGSAPWSPEGVIHLGACSSTTEKDATYLVQNNFECTKLLAEWTLRQGARFLYASSAATYGDGERGFSDDDSAAHLDSLQPLNAYAFSKQVFDLWATRNGMMSQIAGLKYFNVYGPNEYHKGDMRSMVCKAFEQIRATGMVRLFKSDRPEYEHGGQQRDFLYVKDAAAMTLHLLDHPAENGLFNIGSGKAESWNALMGGLFDAMELPHRIEYVEMPAHLRGRYQYHTEASLGKIRKAGYDAAITPLREAVRDYAQNYLLSGKHLGGAPRADA
jgi:ADP-L-glycero-D-manno-heptose 6-epimerase